MKKTKIYMEQKISYNAKEIEKLLKTKTILYSLWDCESETGWTNYQFDSPLRKIFGKVIKFDPRKRRFQYGSRLMKKKFLEIIKKEKPDFVFLMIGSDEINIDTLEEIKKISPTSKTIALLTDEDVEFEVFSRYYSLFVDYCMVTQPKYLELYKKDGLKNGFPMVGLNLDLFKPLNVKKIYDVSFVGQQYPPRVDLIRFLLKNKINVNLWGPGWLDYKDLKDSIKGAAVNVKKYAEIINESKITLGLVKNKYGNPHVSHRPFEVAACKGFQLLDYAPEYLDYFEKDKEIVFFKDKKELLKKINYYLENDKTREEIASRAYQRVINNYDIVKALKHFFKNVLEDQSVSKKEVSELYKKIISLNAADLKKDFLGIKKLIKNYDYISFSDKHSENHKYKEYLQAYSLEKTKKDISCCDCSLYFENLGDLLVFKSYRYFKFSEKKEFHSLINLNQLMIKKEFFLRNLIKFKKMAEGRKQILINKKNTAFVSIPLLRIKKIDKNTLKIINKLSKESMDKAFQVNFAFVLYSLIKRKKILIDGYFYDLIKLSIINNYSFITSYLKNSILSKETLSKFRKLIMN